VNKFIIIVLLFLLVNCSLDTKSGIWDKDDKLKQTEFKLQKILNEDEVFEKEFNSNFILKIKNNQNDLNNLNDTNNTDILQSQLNFKKINSFKFKKISNFRNFEPDLVSNQDSFIFFDDKRNILKFNKDFKLVWKKNYYSKTEKKNNPLLSFALSNNKLIVTDTIGKIYNIDINSGELIWSKKNNHPFNSQVKIYNEKIFVIDMNNILSCYSLENGKKFWSFNSENTFLKSNKRKSIAIYNNIVYFNNSIGDIIALNSEDGSLIWQIPTQSSSIYENAFNMKMSDLVIYENDIFFSNNRNQFYSINLINGVLNWRQSVNSNLRPIIIDKIILTISNEGFLFVIDKEKGNILRVTDVFDIFKIKNRSKIYPVGFVATENNLLISLNNGKLLIVDTSSGKARSIVKLDNSKISSPFVFDNKIFLIKDDAIIKLD